MIDKRREKARSKGNRGKWERYEREKARLASMNLTPREYEARIKEISMRLGL
jgi:hypothetical protein